MYSSLSRTILHQYAAVEGPMGRVLTLLLHPCTSVLAEAPYARCHADVAIG